MRWWMKMIAALAAIALLAFLGFQLISGMLGLLSGADLNASEPDPMFAEEILHPTRPAELDEEGAVPRRPTLDDLPAPEGAPVDKTAEELIREALQRSAT